MIARWQPCLWVLWLALASRCAATCAIEGQCDSVDAIDDTMYVSLLQESLHLGANKAGKNGAKRRVHVSASMLEAPKDTDSAAEITLDDAKEAKPNAKPKGDSKKNGNAEKVTKEGEPTELDPDAEIKNRLGPEYTITYKFPKAVWAIFAMAGCTWVLSMVLVYVFCFHRTNSDLKPMSRSISAHAPMSPRRQLEEYDLARSTSTMTSTPPTSPGGTRRLPQSPSTPGGTYRRAEELVTETVQAVEATLAQKCMAEAVGTFLNVLGGCSVGSADKYLHCGLGLLGQSIAWGVSVALSIFAAREVSGGHCNPACTVSMWFHNGFPLRHVPFYISAQVCGAALAGCMVYGMFSGGIAALEVTQKLPRGTSATTFAGAFGLVPGPPWLSGAGACGVEFVASTFLIFIVFTVTDWEGPVPKNAQPILIGTAVALMVAAFGSLDGAGMNPARDTGPRIVCYFAGWGNIAFAFWWCYTLGPICGGIFGGWLYNRFFKTLSKQTPSPTPASQHRI